ncbi:tyrosine-type recombinase/integrase [Oceanobacter sp. 3_MG-2023]|uniref:phage integrase n=1 Tax=Oceanobacter sp. 3_MG-2023 TaxID=3062622 RepID=UPI0027364423|nr:tyrosine-type recombinase/integrase [Oceanobacter sp. 3_MG-2023]MDP2506710.1 tyrosine-type recombinase/integrase [Oceanobacter sp. 3_MG-2023]
MTVRKHRDGWMVDVTVKNQRHREHGFKTRTQAKRREDIIRSSGGIAGRHVLLVEFVDKWQTLHGVHLRDRYRYSRTRAIAERIGGFVHNFTAADFADYRIERLKTASVCTVNHETRYFRALFNEMKRLGHYYDENPMAGIRVIPEMETELSYLTIPQINQLIPLLDRSRNPHVGIVARVCLATGARWAEANGLTENDLIDRPSGCLVRFTRTKNGRTRYVPVDRSLMDQIREKGDAGGALFLPARDAFRSVVARSGFEMPKGQMTHILRHSFASHFMMNGGDILTLQKVLGHSDLKLTMRYAHLSPDHLSSVVLLNPLVSMTAT